MGLADGPNQDDMLFPWQKIKIFLLNSNLRCAVIGHLVWKWVMVAIEVLI